MSNYYEDVYLKRLNRYGYDYQSRVQAQREREFEGKLLKSVYRVDFDYEDAFKDFILKEGRLSNKNIGRIEVKRKNSIVEIEENEED